MTRLIYLQNECALRKHTTRNIYSHFSKVWNDADDVQKKSPLLRKHIRRGRMGLSYELCSLCTVWTMHHPGIMDLTIIDDNEFIRRR